MERGLRRIYIQIRRSFDQRYPSSISRLAVPTKQQTRSAAPQSTRRHLFISLFLSCRHLLSTSLRLQSPSMRGGIQCMAPQTTLHKMQIDHFPNDDDQQAKRRGFLYTARPYVKCCIQRNGRGTLLRGVSFDQVLSLSLLLIDCIRVALSWVYHIPFTNDDCSFCRFQWRTLSATGGIVSFNSVQ